MKKGTFWDQPEAMQTLLCKRKVAQLYMEDEAKKRIKSDDSFNTYCTRKLGKDAYDW